MNLVNVWCSAVVPPLLTSLGTGYVAFPQSFTGLGLLQVWTVQPLTHRKLQHLSLSGAVASWIREICAGFGAEAPFSPLTQPTVSGEEAGSDGCGQIFEHAQTVTEKQQECIIEQANNKRV